MKKTLVLLTLDFPDPLVEKELPILSSHFEHIYVLPSLAGHEAKTAQLPVNVSVERIFPLVDLTNIKTLFARFFFPTVRIFLWTLANSPYRFRYIRYFKSFVGYAILELTKVQPLKVFVQKKNLADALFYDYWFVDATLALAELKRQGIIKKSVSRTHGFDLYNDRQYEGCVSFKEYRLKYLDAVFAISRHGKEHFKQNVPFTLAEKIKMSYLGVSGGGLPLDKVKYNEPLVVSCARLIPLKRISLLVDVLQKLDMPVRWVHFGDGPEAELIRHKAAQLPSKVIYELRGEVNNEEIQAFYRQHHVDLFISLSESEGLPVSMMEAISWGIPVLSCDVNGIPEIVTPITGKLIPVMADASQIAEHVRNSLLLHFNRTEINEFSNHYFNAHTNYMAFANQLLSVAEMQQGNFYQQCTRCILDNRDDPAIEFNQQGICSYCQKFDEQEKIWEGRRNNPEVLKTLVNQIKAAGAGRQYDCILGISGGVDSTYLALKVKELKLRPLLVHFDNGWNSELAVKNIENIVRKLEFDLHTLVVDWEEFRELQLAFFRASVVDLEIPTDHAMLATLYKLAIEHDIKYILSGHNNATELILPERWYYNKRDHVHIRAINKRFGRLPLKTFPLLSTALKLQVQKRGIESVTLLNYLDYNKEKAKQTIKEELGWKDYGGKHYESIFTRFYQGYILVEKFGVDKRKAHLSNLICSGQITRPQALEEINKPPYNKDLFDADFAFVLKKLGLTTEHFEALMRAPVRLHTDYPVDTSVYKRFWILNLLKPLWMLYKRLKKA